MEAQEEHHALDRDEILRRIDANADKLRRLWGCKPGRLRRRRARRGDGRSDIDVLVELSPKILDAHMDVKLCLERLLGCSVDLVLRGALKERLRPRILAEAVHASRL
jgi:predicted nucleotidyltransferase